MLVIEQCVLCCQTAAFHVQQRLHTLHGQRLQQELSRS
jgi:hypothetical protein